MKISSKSRYGLRAVCYMAEKFGQGVCALSAIAEDLGVSEKYLEQLMSALRKAGLVQSKIGAQGGYYLEKDPTQISVGQILRVLEDGLMIVDCISGDCTSKCGQNQKCQCHTINVWNKLYKTINECLDNITIASIIEK